MLEIGISKGGENGGFFDLLFRLFWCLSMPSFSEGRKLPVSCFYLMIKLPGGVLKGSTFLNHMICRLHTTVELDLLEKKFYIRSCSFYFPIYLVIGYICYLSVFVYLPV